MKGVFMMNLIFFAENTNRVVVALAHLLPVSSRDNGDIFLDARFRNSKALAIGVIELDGDVASDFNVLFLILSNGDGICVVK